jgi:inorganic pyrophosphatase
VPDDINVIVEIPAHGEPVKYEVDKDTGAMFVDRFMNTAMHYPCNYGYVPHTLSEDSDPVDVLVVTPVPLIPGSVIRCRPVGLLKMTDESGPDAKVLAIPVDKLCGLYTSTGPRTCRPHCSPRSRTSSSTTRTWSPASG